MCKLDTQSVSNNNKLLSSVIVSKLDDVHSSLTVVSLNNIERNLIKYDQIQYEITQYKLLNIVSLTLDNSQCRFKKKNYPKQFT